MSGIQWIDVLPAVRHSVSRYHQEERMEPSLKASGIDSLIQGITGKSRVDTINGRKCMTCEVEEIPPFKDALSIKEYTISGMCQECQDQVFK